MDQGVLLEARQAQAAAWLARLRSEARTSSDEAGFRAWLGEHPSHQEAFDDINAAYELAGARRRRLLSRAPLRLGVGFGLGLGLAAAAAFGAFMLFGPGLAPVETFSTGRGEQRTVALRDGSTVLLDTASKVEVRFGPRLRRIQLVEGRAHFEVAKDRRRPFIVDGGAGRVVAVGTVFDVSRTAGKTSVVLTEGKVLLRYGRNVRPMTPGDRVSLRGGQVVADRPALDTLTAWQSGRAVFESEPLSEVVDELNRYSRRPLVIADRNLAAMRISGTYKTGDVGAFAVSLSRLLPVEVAAEPDRITLVARSQ